MLRCPCFVFELGDHLAVEHDGARHQLGEKQHKDAVVVKPLQNLLALADGDQKRELLEGEKADAQRQGNAFQNQGGVEQSIDVLHKKIPVFEVAQKPHIEQDTQPEKHRPGGTLAPAHAVGQNVVGQN